MNYMANQTTAARVTPQRRNRTNHSTSPNRRSVRQRRGTNHVIVTPTSIRQGARIESISVNHSGRTYTPLVCHNELVRETQTVHALTRTPPIIRPMNINLE